jgi:hypothetical protein
MHLTENVEMCMVMGCELIINCHNFTLPEKAYTYEQVGCKYSSFERGENCPKTQMGTESIFQ